MIKKNAIIFILIFCLFSCQNKKPKYYYLSYNNPITDVVVDGGLQDSLEVGKWAFYDQKKVLLSKGNYNNGLKEGNWLFYIDSAYVNLNWSILKNDTSKFSINHPSKWKVSADKFSLFQASFDDIDTLHEKYFHVCKITNDTNSISCYEYSKKFINRTKTCFTVNFSIRLILKNGNREIYINKADIDFHKKKLSIYEACVEINSIVYDFVYSTDDLSDLSGVIFFNMLEGCFIDNKRIINPLIPYTFENVKNE